MIKKKWNQRNTKQCDKRKSQKYEKQIHSVTADAFKNV